jgi:Putative Ig domain
VYSVDTTAPVPNTPDSPNNIGALIMLSNPTPPLFPPSTGGGYSLLPFRGPNPTWNGYETYSPSRLSLYGNLQDYDLYLTGSLRNQVVLEMHNYSFSVPPGTFRHTNPNEQLGYEATQLDGSPLPSWLHFNPKQLKFSGVPPKGAMDTEVMVKAFDSYGNEAYATFKVTVNKERDYNHKDRLKLEGEHHTHMPHRHSHMSDPINQQANMVGKLAFHEQLNSAGKLSRLMESRALLDSLSQL